MKPEYANTFGLRKVADPQGRSWRSPWISPISIWRMPSPSPPTGWRTSLLPMRITCLHRYEPAECHFSAQPPYPVPGGRDSLSRVERPEPFDGTTAIRPKGRSCGRNDEKR